MSKCNADDRLRLRRMKKQHLIERVLELEMQLSEEIVARCLRAQAYQKLENELRNSERQAAAAVDIVRQQREVIEQLQAQ